MASVHLFGDLWTGKVVKVSMWCDSKHVRGVLRKKSSDDEFLMICTRWLCQAAHLKRFRWKVFYINTKDNLLADMLSRDAEDEFWEEIRLMRLKKGFFPVDLEPTPMSLPREVSDFYNASL